MIRSITTPCRLNAILQQAPLAFCNGFGWGVGGLLDPSLRVGGHYNFNFVLRFTVFTVGDIQLKRCMRGSVASLFSLFSQALPAVPKILST